MTHEDWIAVIDTNLTGQTNYSTAKAGIHGLTMALAQEVATKGVTVNTVSPGYIGTEMVKTIRPEVLEKIVATIPRSARRLGTPDEIGSIVAWLASDESGFSTGADFSLNERRLAYGLTGDGFPFNAPATCANGRPSLAGFINDAVNTQQRFFCDIARHACCHRSKVLRLVLQGVQ